MMETLDQSHAKPGGSHTLSVTMVCPVAEYASYLAKTLSGVDGALVVLRPVAAIEELGSDSGCVGDAILLDASELADPAAVARAVEGVRRGANDTPVVVLTGAWGDAELAAIDRGAQDCLPKDQATPRSIARALLFAVKRSRAMVASERQRLHAALVRRRKAEAQALARLTQGQPGSSWRLVRDGVSLRETLPETFDEMVIEYGELLGRSEDDSGEGCSEALASLGERIGLMRGGTRSVVEVHNESVRNLFRAGNAEDAQRQIDNGIALLLELLGHVAEYYRRNGQGAQGLGPQW